jgi:hypothetical protein
MPRPQVRVVGVLSLIIVSVFVLYQLTRSSTQIPISRLKKCNVNDPDCENVLLLPTRGPPTREEFQSLQDEVTSLASNVARLGNLAAQKTASAEATKADSLRVECGTSVMRNIDSQHVTPHTIDEG